MRFPHTLRFAALQWIALSVAAAAQTPESGQTPAARLEHLDNTYSSNLRKYHAPIIQDYLVSLEKLRQTMAQRNHTDETAAVQAEINRVKSIGAGSGLLPYEVLKPAPPENKTSKTPAPNPPADKLLKKGAPAGAILLAAAAAKKSSPDPSRLAERPDGRAVPVGSAEWRIDRIPAGDHRISILYSCAGKPADSAIVARLGQNSVQHALTAAHATGGVNEFRIARLGVISLEKDGAGENLVLENSDPASAAIWVRQVIIVKVAEKDKK
jgi:hypothetical protein